MVVIKKVICGAAPCGESLISQFMKKAPESLLFKEGWGMTEVIVIINGLVIDVSYGKGSKTRVTENFQ